MKEKLQKAGRFLTENRETICAVFIFAVSFVAALIESEGKPRTK